jgi:hypothetical protein
MAMIDQGGCFMNPYRISETPTARGENLIAGLSLSPRAIESVAGIERTRGRPDQSVFSPRVVDFGRANVATPGEKSSQNRTLTGRRRIGTHRSGPGHGRP